MLVITFDRMVLYEQTNTEVDNTNNKHMEEVYAER
jgi:hypothetical protein